MKKPQPVRAGALVAISGGGELITGGDCHNGA